MITIVNDPRITIEEIAKQRQVVSEVIAELQACFRFLQSRGERFLVHFGIDNARDRVWDYIKVKGCQKGRDTCGDRPCWCGLCYGVEPCDCKACVSGVRIWIQ